MKKVLKWIGILLASIMVVLILAFAAFEIYINYEPEMTDDQKNSLDKINGLGDQIPSPDAYSEEIPEAIPEIYTDQLEDEDEGENFITPEEYYNR